MYCLRKQKTYTPDKIFNELIFEFSKKIQDYKSYLIDLQFAMKEKVSIGGTSIVQKTIKRYNDKFP